jgi:hypothetical protein
MGVEELGVHQHTDHVANEIEAGEPERDAADEFDQGIQPLQDNAEFESRVKPLLGKDSHGIPGVPFAAEDARLM